MIGLPPRWLQDKSLGVGAVCILLTTAEDSARLIERGPHRAGRLAIKENISDWNDLHGGLP
jgi:hypothetical protein